MQNPLLAKLGVSPESRLVLFHADDVGMCHGSNQAFLELAEFGIVKCGSVMVPCPWSPEILSEAQRNPTLDLGVHLTLTSEWSNYRWGAISTRQAQSGLLDPQGYFYHRTHQARAAMNVDAAIAELQTQAARAQEAGLDISHFDTHMGVAFVPELLHAYLQLGREYAAPTLMMRDSTLYTTVLGISAHELGDWAALLATIEATAHPIFDHFLITPEHHPNGRDADRGELYEAMLRSLPAGSLTFFSLHPNAPGDIDVIIPDRAYWRTFEYNYFRSNRLADFLAQEKIIPIGFRELREVMRSK